MDDPFFGPAIKIQRANRLLGELITREATFWDGCKPFIDTDPDPETGRRFARVRVRESPPEMIHVLAAEVIYHLRSTLDQIAVRLAIMSNVSKRNLSKVYFPCGKGPREFVFDARGESRPRHERRMVEQPWVKRKKGKIERLEPDLIKLILRQKAYPGGDDDVHSIFPLANIDKHVELIPAASNGHLRFMSNIKIENPISSLIVSGGMYNLNEGIPIVELGPHGTITRNNADTEIELAGQISFGNTSVHNGMPIALVLSRLVRRVSDLLQTVTDHCIRTGRMPSP
jgi:hypothetical protein